MQKTYISDCISRKSIRNNGQLPNLPDHHEAIVGRQTFDAVRAEMARRSAGAKPLPKERAHRPDLLRQQIRPLGASGVHCVKHSKVLTGVLKLFLLNIGTPLQILRAYPEIKDEREVVCAKQ